MVDDENVGGLCPPSRPQEKARSLPDEGTGGLQAGCVFRRHPAPGRLVAAVEVQLRPVARLRLPEPDQQPRLEPRVLERRRRLMTDCRPSQKAEIVAPAFE